MIELTTTEQALLLAGSFLFFTFLESIIPLLQEKYKRVRHAGINLFFIITSAFVSLPFAFLAVHSSNWVTRHDFGVLNFVQVPSWLFIITGFMMLDFLTSYLPHFIQHKIKWMWKFHLVHHTDTWVDASTANRHHPGETVISMLFLIGAVFITGAPAWLIILHQFAGAAFSQFTHANISLPAKIDHAISWVFISPNMHKVHHHHTQPLTDTNYGNIFSIWDRLFKTYAKSNMADLKYGIDTHPDKEEHDNMGKLLVIPFEEYRPPTTQPG
jgi:sterol desaturase/sphingolipid hydroxylase (fatty acid hydroxylase superfamily)